MGRRCISFAWSCRPLPPATLPPSPRTQVLILMSGMVFVSKGFPPGSDGYKALTAFVATVVVSATASFLLFVAFEVCTGAYCAGKAAR